MDQTKIILEDAKVLSRASDFISRIDSNGDMTDLYMTLYDAANNRTAAIKDVKKNEQVYAVLLSKRMTSLLRVAVQSGYTLENQFIQIIDINNAALFKSGNLLQIFGIQIDNESTYSDIAHLILKVYEPYDGSDDIVTPSVKPSPGAEGTGFADAFGDGEGGGISREQLSDEDFAEMFNMGPEGDTPPKDGNTPPLQPQSPDLSSDLLEIEKYYRGFLEAGGNVQTTLTALQDRIQILYGACYDDGVAVPYGLVMKSGNGSSVRLADLSESTHADSYIHYAYDSIQMATNYNYMVLSNIQYSKNAVVSEEKLVFLDIHTLGLFGYPEIFDSTIFCYDNFLKCGGSQASFASRNDKNRFIKISDLKRYISWIFKMKMLLMFKEAGITDEANSTNNRMLSSEITKFMIRNISNVIAVVEKTNFNCLIKTSAAGLKNKIERVVNPGIDDEDTSEKDIEVRTKSTKTIHEYNIILNKSVYFEQSLYAHQVLDSLIASGNQPGIGNIILGKDLSGSIISEKGLRDNTAKSLFVYAGSRSGKGVMTLNIIAAAIASKVPVIYIDGKPDSSIQLARIALKNNKNYAVFNGYEEAATLESLTGDKYREELIKVGQRNGNIPLGVLTDTAELRKQSHAPAGTEDGDLHKQLKGQFENIKDVENAGGDKSSHLAKQFRYVTQYFKALEVYFDSINKFKYNSENGWQTPKKYICVLDELKEMRNDEFSLFGRLHELSEAKVNVTNEKGKVSTVKLTQVRPDIGEFVQSMLDWRNRLKEAASTFDVIGGGRRNGLIICIFQTTDILDKNYSDTLVYHLLKLYAGTTRKFIGKNALVYDVGAGGSTSIGVKSTSTPSEWYDLIQNYAYFTSISGAVNSKSQADTFKPFNIFSEIMVNPSDPGKDSYHMMVTKAVSEGKVANADNPVELIGSALTPDMKSVIPEVAIEPYLNKLFKAFNLGNPADAIEIGYKYSIQAVAEFYGVSDTNILEYIYDLTHFGISGFTSKTKNGETSESTSDAASRFFNNIGSGSSGGSGQQIQEVAATPVGEAGNEVGGAVGGWVGGLDGAGAGAANTGRDTPEPQQSSRFSDTSQPQFTNTLHMGEYNSGATPNTSTTSHDLPNPKQTSPNQGNVYSDPYASFTQQSQQQQKPRVPVERISYPPEVSSAAKRINQQFGIPLEQALKFAAVSYEKPIEQMHYSNDNSYSVNANNGKVTFQEIPQHLQKIEMNRGENSVSITEYDPTLSRNKKLFKSVRGIEYDLEQRWATILSEVNRSHKKGYVISAIIHTDFLSFDSLLVNPGGYVNGPDGVKMDDIFSFTTLSKMMPGLKRLEVDRSVYEVALDEFGSNNIDMMIFSRLKNLSSLTIVGYAEPLTIRRTDLIANLENKQQQEKLQRARQQSSDRTDEMKLRRSLSVGSAFRDNRTDTNKMLKQIRGRKRSKSLQGKMKAACENRYGSRGIRGAGTVAMRKFGTAIKGLLRFTS